MIRSPPVLSYCTPSLKYPRGVSIASGIVFRDLTSTKQKALGISLEFLKNGVECCRRATPLAHEIPEFLEAVLGGAGQAVKIISERYLKLTRQVLERLSRRLEIGNGLGDVVLALIEHGGDVLHVGQRLVDRFLVLGDEIIEPRQQGIGVVHDRGSGIEQALAPSPVGPNHGNRSLRGRHQKRR